jgi:hypothetical protein
MHAQELLRVVCPGRNSIDLNAPDTIAQRFWPYRPIRRTDDPFDALSPIQSGYADACTN